ncbi:MAG: hypothetical protein H6729_02965 [Deltaproteobacteria bacterium]|nr:hypothetical protein [Deltaproteobacteria bacterium]
MRTKNKRTRVMTNDPRGARANVSPPRSQISAKSHRNRMLAASEAERLVQRAVAPLLDTDRFHRAPRLRLPAMCTVRTEDMEAAYRVLVGGGSRVVDAPVFERRADAVLEFGSPLVSLGFGSANVAELRQLGVAFARLKTTVECHPGAAEWVEALVTERSGEAQNAIARGAHQVEKRSAESTVRRREALPAFLRAALRDLLARDRILLPEADSAAVVRTALESFAPRSNQADVEHACRAANRALARTRDDVQRIATSARGSEAARPLGRARLVGAMGQALGMAASFDRPEDVLRALERARSPLSEGVRAMRVLDGSTEHRTAQQIRAAAAVERLLSALL